MKLRELNENELIEGLRKLNERLMTPEGPEALSEFEEGYENAVERVVLWQEAGDRDALEALTLMWRSVERSDRIDASQPIALLREALSLGGTTDVQRAFGNLGLGKLLVKKGLYEEALQAALRCRSEAEHIEARMPTDTRPLAKAFDLEGVALLGMGEYGRAAGRLEKANELLHMELGILPPTEPRKPGSDTHRSLKNDIAEANLHLESCYLKLNEPSKAATARSKRMEMYSEVGNAFGENLAS